VTPPADNIRLFAETGDGINEASVIRPQGSESDKIRSWQNLTPQERLRLLRLISAHPKADDSMAYGALRPSAEEFSSEEDPLAWDSEGWEGLS